MPRVVPDQKNKYETDELFKKLSQDVEVCDMHTVCMHEAQPLLAGSLWPLLELVWCVVFLETSSMAYCIGIHNEN